MAQIPSGVFAPVATLFDGAGELDLENFRSNLKWYATSPLDGVVIMGSNGEYVSLDMQEKLRLIEAGVEAVDGRKTVFAGTGMESTRNTIFLTKKAAELGADFALVVTPHYYKPRYDDAAVIRHYETVADASPIPILIYIMAAYTGVDLPTPVVSKLSKHPNIVGVKDSAGSAPKLSEMVAFADDDFAVLAGSASFLYPALCVGARGGVLALANVAPHACAELYAHFTNGEHDAARRLQHRLLRPNSAVTSQFGIAGLKAAMELVGLKSSDPRPPLLPATSEERESVQKIFEQAELLARV